MDYASTVKLRAELEDPEMYTNILQHHELVRLFGSKNQDSNEITSGLSIVRIISLYAYIHKL